MFFRGLNIGILFYIVFFPMKEIGFVIQELDSVLFDDYLILTGFLFYWAIFCLINGLYHIFFVRD